jgi:chromosome segregation ATPase
LDVSFFMGKTSTRRTPKASSATHFEKARADTKKKDSPYQTLKKEKQQLTTEVSELTAALAATTVELEAHRAGPGGDATAAQSAALAAATAELEAHRAAASIPGGCATARSLFSAAAAADDDDDDDDGGSGGRRRRLGRTISQQTPPKFRTERRENDAELLIAERVADGTLVTSTDHDTVRNRVLQLSSEKSSLTEKLLRAAAGLIAVDATAKEQQTAADAKLTAVDAKLTEANAKLTEANATLAQADTVYALAVSAPI